MTFKKNKGHKPSPGSRAGQNLTFTTKNGSFKLNLTCKDLQQIHINKKQISNKSVNIPIQLFLLLVKAFEDILRDIVMCPSGKAATSINNENNEQSAYHKPIKAMRSHLPDCKQYSPLPVFP